MGVYIIYIFIAFLNFSQLFSQEGTLIFSAVESGNLKRVKEIVALGVDLKTRNTSGQTPFMIVLQNRNEELINYFLGLTLDFDEEDVSGNNILHYLVNSNNEQIIKKLLSKDKLVLKVNQKNNNGISPLRLAIENKNDHLVQFIVKSGADIEEIENGKSILIEAHEEYLKSKSPQSLKILISLINYGANVNIRTSNTIRENSNIKKSLIYEFTELGEKDLCKIAIEKGANYKEKIEGNSLLHLAVEKGHKTLISLYLDYAILIDEKGENNETPLFWAVKKGNFEITKFLISKGANPNLANITGDTPLTVSVSRMDLDTTRFLLDKGADINVINEIGNTLLIEASKGNHTSKKNSIEMITLLLKYGLNINSKNIYGNTALSYALNRRNQIHIKYLLKNGADINIVDSMGNTILHKIVLYALFERLKNKELDEIFEIVSSYSINPNIKNNDGMTPLHLAVKPSKEKDEKAGIQIIKKLLDISADPKIEDRLGANVYDYSKGDILALLKINDGSIKKDNDFQISTSTPFEGKSISLDYFNNYLYHLGEINEKKIVSKFSMDGVLQANVWMDGAHSQYVHKDGIYYIGSEKKNPPKGGCQMSIIISKLNQELQLYYKVSVEENLNCSNSYPISVFGDSLNNIYIQYKNNSGIKILKINPTDGKTDLVIPINEEIDKVSIVDRKTIFSGKNGSFILDSDYKVKEKKIWSEKKNLLVAYSESGIYSVLPIKDKPSFTVTKSDLNYETLWKNKYSSNSIDQPKNLVVQGKDIYIAGETNGNLHGNLNRANVQSVFLMKIGNDGNRKYTFQSKNNVSESLAGLCTLPDGTVFLYGSTNPIETKKSSIFIYKVK